MLSRSFPSVNDKRTAGGRGVTRRIIDVFVAVVCLSPVTVAANQILVEAELVEVDATDGLCSLIEALANAQDGSTGLIHEDCAAGDPASGDIVELAPGSAYLLMSADNSVAGGNGLPVISTEVELQGNGATIARNSTASNFRILLVDTAGQLTLSTLTLSGGRAGGAFQQGGAIRNAGSLLVNECAILDNTGLSGGGIFNQGSLTIAGSTVGGNTAMASGGAVFNTSQGTVSVMGSAINNNLAELNGGGVFNGGGMIEMGFCAVHDNVAVGAAGGGVENRGELHMTNVTVSRNSAQSGGGLSLSSGGVGSVTACTIADNEFSNVQLGPADPAVLSIGNSIIAGASTGGDCDPGALGVVNDMGFNIVEDGSCISDVSSMAGDPLLGPLMDNGGSTLTHSLLAGSLAIDRGDCAGGSVTTDQRGVQRPQAGACDIGAFELEESQLSIEGSSVSENAGSLSWTVTRSHDAHEVSVDLETVAGTALEGLDYVGFSLMTVTLAAGDGLTRSGAITIIDDAVLELDEFLDLQISNPFQAVILVSSASATIMNDDVVTVGFDLAESVVNEYESTHSVAVGLTGATDIALSVDVVDEVAGSATPGMDYAAFASQTLTFPAGTTDGETALATIDVIDDDEVEMAETIALLVDAGGNPFVVIGVNSQHLVTILDDDDSAVVSASMDIRPGTCSNNVSVRSSGFLAVALAGEQGFDVSMVDVSSLALARADGIGGSVAPNMGKTGPQPRLEDLVSPAEVMDCACVQTLPDGVDDLRVSFRVKEVVNLFDPADFAQGKATELLLTGTLADGSSFVAVDCVTWVGLGQSAKKAAEQPADEVDAPLSRPPACGAFSPLAFILAVPVLALVRGRCRVVLPGQ